MFDTESDALRSQREWNDKFHRDQKRITLLICLAAMALNVLTIVLAVLGESEFMLGFASMGLIASFIFLMISTS